MNKSKELLKALLGGRQFEDNYFNDLAISVYCEANGVDEELFRKKVKDIRDVLYNRCWSNIEDFYKQSEHYLELLLP